MSHKLSGRVESPSVRIYNQDERVAGLRQVMREHRCPDERIFFRLHGAGMIRCNGRKVVPRCALYARYFAEHLGP
ncbi:MAG: AAA-like domain-containing protein [Myxococcota bacterium]